MHWEWPSKAGRRGRGAHTPTQLQLGRGETATQAHKQPKKLSKEPDTASELAKTEEKLYSGIRRVPEVGGGAGRRDGYAGKMRKRDEEDIRNNRV